MRRYLRCCDADYHIMGTLTYPAEYPKDGRIVKGHLRAFIERCRRYHEKNGNNGWSIFWFLEFQERGAPHFHFFTNFEIDKGLLALWWHDIVDSRDSRHLLAGTRIEYLRAGRSGTLGYAAKYAAKSSQKEVPPCFANVGRFWGAVGLVSCHAFFLLVSFDDLLGETHKRMQFALRAALKRADGHWKKINFGERAALAAGITMFDEKLCSEVKCILERYGCLLALRNPVTVVEYPSIGLLPGEIV